MPSSTNARRTPKLPDDDRTSFNGDHLLILAFALAAAFALMVHRSARSIKEHISGEVVSLKNRAHGPAHPAPAPAEHGAAYHWSEYFTKIEEEMADLGITERQREVALGILDHQSYAQIAHRMRVQERTVRDHAKLLFKKAGCAGKADFPHAILRAVGSGGPGEERPASKL